VRLHHSRDLCETGFLAFVAKNLTSSRSNYEGVIDEDASDASAAAVACDVVACIALAVALAPASYATVSQLVPTNSVGTPQLQNEAVTSNKVRDFSLRAWDFKKGDLESLMGGMTVRQSSVAVPAGPVAHNGLYVTRVIQVRCQPGQRAVSGGTSWSSDKDGEELVTVYSKPVMEKGVPVGWRARGGSDVGAARVFSVEVLCA